MARVKTNATRIYEATKREVQRRQVLAFNAQHGFESGQYAEITERRTRISPAEPTDAPPGSMGKVEVLAARLLSGEHLWHPEDRLDYEHYTRS